ncbi:uncharacterized protein [Melanerpes formicivorus]|uniref:uncharacterized protein n=1 Tax=Melanerpes formicivorus TaxID=211600 RepID=UPI00358EEE34
MSLPLSGKMASALPSLPLHGAHPPRLAGAGLPRRSQTAAILLMGYECNLRLTNPQCPFCNSVLHVTLNVSIWARPRHQTAAGAEHRGCEGCLAGAARSGSACCAKWRLASWVLLFYRQIHGHIIIRADESNSQGKEALHPRVLKELADRDAKSFSIIFEKSLEPRRRETLYLILKGVKKRTLEITDLSTSPLCLGRSWNRSYTKSHGGQGLDSRRHGFTKAMSCLTNLDTKWYRRTIEFQANTFPTTPLLTACHNWTRTQLEITETP